MLGSNQSRHKGLNRGLLRKNDHRSASLQSLKNCLRFEVLEPRLLLNAGPSSTGTAAAVVAPISSAAVVAAAVSAQALLPDLTPWADQARGFMYDWTLQGNDLRFTTAMANLGTGPLELRGGATHGTTQDVFQRIYEPGGGFTDVQAGTFTYHPEHGHIHFDGFAQFRLRTVLAGGGVGAIVASSDKVSFCLLDVERYNTSGPNSPRFLNCGQVQGVSVGWADVYDRGLPGQSIDVSAVANGTYWLEVVVDPDNRLLESNETNNTTRIQVTLQRSTGGGGIAADTFEANNSFAAASILAPPEDHTYTGLTVHSAQDVDFYRVTASASGAMTLKTTFLNSQGDLDLEVFNSSQTLLGRSESTSNAEQFTFTAVAGQYYFVRTYGYRGATNPNYTLLVDQPVGPGIVADQYEENDTFATAKTLSAVDQTYPNLTLNTLNDDDYYRIVPTVTGTMNVSLAFQNAQGNVNLSVLNSAQTRLGFSESTTDAERVSVAVTAGQAYVIRVYGYQGVVSPNYSLTIDVPSIVNSVVYLSTDSGGNVSGTDGLPAVNAFTGSDILKLTLRSDGTYGYGMYFDGSDVGLSDPSEDVDAFWIMPDGGILLSTVGAFSVPISNGGVIAGGGEDVLRFGPISLGDTTTGWWSWYFDGSDVGLTTAEENIDAISVLSNGRVLISTSGAVTTTGATGDDEDVLQFVPTSVGFNTAGTWSVYFDGSDVGLATNDGEDVDAIDVRETAGNPTLYFSTLGAFSVTGASGENEDLVAFTPTTLGATTAGTFAAGLAFDGSLYGLTNFNVDSFHRTTVATAALAAAAPSTSLSGVTSLAASTAVAPAAASNIAARSTARSTTAQAAVDSALTSLSASKASKTRSNSASASLGVSQVLPTGSKPLAADKAKPIPPSSLDALDQVFALIGLELCQSRRLG